jgi:hypothetical protein
LLEIPQQDSRGGPDIGNHHFQWEIKIIQHEMPPMPQEKKQRVKVEQLSPLARDPFTQRPASKKQLLNQQDGAKTMVAMRNYLISRKYPVDKMVLFQDNKASQLIIDKGIQSAKKIGSERFCSD